MNMLTAAGSTAIASAATSAATSASPSADASSASASGDATITLLAPLLLASNSNLETRNLDTSTTSTRTPPRKLRALLMQNLRKPSKAVSSE